MLQTMDSFSTLVYADVRTPCLSVLTVRCRRLYHIPFFPIPPANLRHLQAITKTRKQQIIGTEYKKKDGYTGASSTIRMFATRERKLIQKVQKGVQGKTEKIERKCCFPRIRMSQKNGWKMLRH